MTVTIVRGPYTVKALEIRRGLNKLPRKVAMNLERKLILRLAALPAHPTISVGSSLEYLAQQGIELEKLEDVEAADENWLLKLAHQIDDARKKLLEKAETTWDDATLALANELDRAHKAVTDELVKYKPALISSGAVLAVVAGVALYLALRRPAPQRGYA